MSPSELRTGAPVCPPGPAPPAARVNGEGAGRRRAPARAPGRVHPTRLGNPDAFQALVTVCYLERSARLDGDAGELFERGEPGGDLGEAVVPERPHALFDRGALDLLAARLRGGHRLEVLAHHEQLVDADPALVAGLAAAGTAFLAVEDDAVRRGRDLRRDARLDDLVGGRRVHLAAVRAELAGVAGREHRRDCGAGEERLDAHLVQACDRA